MSVLKDRRRILGPTDSVPVQLSQPVKQSEADRMRAQDEIRKIFLQRGVVTNATGSCYLELEGDLRLQCSVNGPKPIRGSFTTRADLSVEVQFSKFTAPHDNSDSDEVNKRAKNFASFIHTALTPAILLENYPKSAISILVSVLSPPDSTNSKSLLAAAVTCASVALADSGISISDIVTAGAATLSRPAGTIYFDPECERGAQDVETVVSYMCAATDGDNVSGFWLDGSEISMDEMASLMKSTKQIATQTRQLVNNELVEDLKAS